MCYTARNNDRQKGYSLEKGNSVKIRVQSSEAKVDLTPEKRKRSQIRARRSETRAALTPEKEKNLKIRAWSGRKRRFILRKMGRMINPRLPARKL